MTPHLSLSLAVYSIVKMNKGHIFIFVAFLTLALGAPPKENCDAVCVCPRIFMPVCNSVGRQLASNECIANCWREKCNSKYEFLTITK